MFPRNENRNEGTFAKTTLLRNRLLSPGEFLVQKDPLGFRRFGRQLSFLSLTFLFYQGNSLKLSRDFGPLSNPPKPWKKQRKNTNNQGNSSLKINQGILGHSLRGRSLKGRCNICVYVPVCVPVCVCVCVCPSSPPHDPAHTVGLNSRIPSTPVHDPSPPFPHPYPQAIARPTPGKNYPKDPPVLKRVRRANSLRREKNATAIAKRYGGCSEVLVFLGKRGRKTVRFEKNYGGSKILRNRVPYYF